MSRSGSTRLCPFQARGTIQFFNPIQVFGRALTGSEVSTWYTTRDAGFALVDYPVKERCASCNASRLRSDIFLMNQSPNTINDDLLAVRIIEAAGQFPLLVQEIQIC